MDIFHKDDTHNIESVIADHEYQSFYERSTSGILCVPESTTGQSLQKVHMPEAYTFAKWVKKNRQDISIDVAPAEGMKDLRSADFWMPLVFLAGNVALPIYLGIVSNYIYDRLRGALKHDTASVHLDVVYKDNTGATKKFSYSGSVEGLEKVMKKFDANRFME